ncbi:UbiX family flavin prenyltransferase [Verticiella sediminum]|uniref:Flavin prenyltransferase UbiX n=1 Tax=Verticiella sediminum TaxID=1247510 RepID=A0A556A7Q8_9BURK|nr:UbiX family flavin prenyltransferase [Verticiella sediminum]TSH88919.1 UbiX family flavin prenyltransferase [Verticiella sediminum]
MSASDTKRRRVVVALTGASGSAYGIRLLEMLREVPDVETHLIVSRSARQTLQLETDVPIEQLEASADVVHASQDIGAAVSSGSFRVHAMVVAPCSIKTMSNLAWGNTGELIARAADVALKERRRVVLMLRETPLHAGHIESMLRVTQAGAIVFPPVPAFYNRPRTVADIVDHSVMRCLDLIDVECEAAPRWTETSRRLLSSATRPAPQPFTVACP